MGKRLRTGISRAALGCSLCYDTVSPSGFYSLWHWRTQRAGAESLSNKSIHPLDAYDWAVRLDVKCMKVEGE